jgi:Tfp pilus assembly protein PilX
MRAQHLPRRSERGNSLLLALIVMSSLATLGSLTVVSVQSSLKASTNDRSQTVALYAAESGAAAAMQSLRASIGAVGAWTPFLSASPPAIVGNNVQPGSPGNAFSAGMNAWYSVVILNNRNDPSASPTADGDNQVIIQATGHGPQGSLAVVEWEVEVSPAPPGPPNKLVHVSWRTVL